MRPKTPINKQQTHTDWCTPTSRWCEMTPPTPDSPPAPSAPPLTLLTPVGQTLGPHKLVDGTRCPLTPLLPPLSVRIWRTHTSRWCRMTGRTRSTCRWPSTSPTTTTGSTRARTSSCWWPAVSPTCCGSTPRRHRTRTPPRSRSVAEVKEDCSGQRW